METVASLAFSPDVHAVESASGLVCERNRFTSFVKSRKCADYAILEKWVAWFRSRGIPAVIGSGPGGYAVYRAGVREAPSVDYVMATWGLTRRQAEAVLTETDPVDPVLDGIRKELRSLAAAGAAAGVAVEGLSSGDGRTRR